MRLGIITHYYNSKNYGGMLQAYALVKVLRDLGYDAEQICYLVESNSTKKSLKSCVKSLINMVIKKKLDRRKKAFKQFEISIPHSKKVYSERDIEQSVVLYDAFITGSDQVWNFKWYISSYFLTFVPSRKKKIAYAASMGTNSLSEEESIRLKEHIKDYTAISLRESDSADFVQTLTSLPVQTTLDPTLLLDLDDWKSISDHKIIKERYLFCYFLGRDKRIRILAKKFAKQHNLEIVTLPNLQQHLEINDLGFGQHRLYDVNPGGFVSLIRNADYVFTQGMNIKEVGTVWDRSAISEFIIAMIFGLDGQQKIRAQYVPRDASGFGGFEDIFNMFGGGFGGFGSSRQTRNGPRRGADIQKRMNITFNEAVFGCKKEIRLTKDCTCDACGGTGAKKGTGKKTCPHCGGTGQVRTVQNTPLGQFQSVRTCDHCGGTGQIIEDPCPACGGTGKVRKTITLNVTIPAGSYTDYVLTLQGQGQPGSNGGPAGDLYIVLNVGDHKLFTRKGDDLWLKVPVTFSQAALGDTVTIPGLSEKLALKVPAGTQPGDVLRMKGKGVPNVRSKRPGDLYAEIVLEVPTKLSAEQKELIKKFGETKTTTGYAKRKSFMDNLKDLFS